MISSSEKVRLSLVFGMVGHLALLVAVEELVVRLDHGVAELQQAVVHISQQLGLLLDLCADAFRHHLGARQYVGGLIDHVLGRLQQRLAELIGGLGEIVLHLQRHDLPPLAMTLRRPWRAQMSVFRTNLRENLRKSSMLRSACSSSSFFSAAATTGTGGGGRTARGTGACLSKASAFSAALGVRGMT